MDESGASHGPRPQPQPGRGGAPADRISSLSDDLLLQILSHLGYASAAARTALLSRRWRRLFPHLPELDVNLRDVPLSSLEDAVRRAARPGVRLLDIAVPAQDRPTAAVSPEKEAMEPCPCGIISSVLREAARLSPAQLRFTVAPNLAVSMMDRYVAVNLPRFHRATSIDLRVPPHLRLKHSRASAGFPALESLSISGCHMDLDTLVPLCPRLCVLTVVTESLGGTDFSVQSFSLQGLFVDRSSIPSCRIVVQAPVLKRLTVSLNASRDFSVSVVVPMVEKVLWRCSYGSAVHGLGLWRLLEVSLETIEGHGWWTGCSNAGTREDACSPVPRVNVLSLRMCVARSSLCCPDGELEFAAELSKHMVTDFSALELLLTARGHDFGSFVWRLLGTPRIRVATQCLRIVMLRSEENATCRQYCPCDEPWDWRIQRIFLPNLEKLEIEGFKGKDCEFEFLKLVLERARMLTRVTVKLPDQITPDDDWCTKLYDIFAAYPSVEASIDLIRGN